MVLGADVEETLLRAVSQALTGLSDGISGQEGSTHGVLMTTHLGQKITFTQSERLSSGTRNWFQGLGWNEVRASGAKKSEEISSSVVNRVSLTKGMLRSWQIRQRKCWSWHSLRSSECPVLEFKVQEGVGCPGPMRTDASSRASD